MIAQVTELTGSKNGIKIQVSWLKGRILSSTPKGGMRTEDRMDSKTKQSHRTGSETNMEGLHCAQHAVVPGALTEGQRLGLGLGHGFCAGPTFSGFSLFLPHQHNGLYFFHLIMIHRSSHQHFKQHYCCPIYLSFPKPSRYRAGLWEFVYLQHQSSQQLWGAKRNSLSGGLEGKVTWESASLHEEQLSASDLPGPVSWDVSTRAADCGPASSVKWEAVSLGFI